MGVRRGGKTGICPPWKLGLRTKIFLKTCSERLIQINWLTSCNDSLFADISTVGRRECKRTPKNFDVVKIRAKSLKIGKIRRNLGKIYENLDKTPENLGKLLENTAKIAPNVLWFEKIGPQRVQNHMKTIFFQKRSSWEEFAQKVVQNFFGQVWGNSGKNPSRPQNFACFYSYGRYDPLIAQEAGLFL